ncbi:MAG: TRAP transporter small permease [Deltaproteobacteria bacterium]|nr:TRAP transporter small permease [Deltaproteobacteria bacterium]
MKFLDVIVRPVSKGMFWIAAVALTSIMLLTVADVALRFFKMPILGTYELVGFLAAWAIGFAIPQTSIDKGHVGMDFLTGKLPDWINRLLVPLTRMIGAVTFAVVAYNLYKMGNDLIASGDTTPLRQLPLFPLAYGLGLACLVETLVLLAGLFGDNGAHS